LYLQVPVTLPLHWLNEQPLQWSLWTQNWLWLGYRSVGTSLYCGSAGCAAEASEGYFHLGMAAWHLGRGTSSCVCVQLGLGQRTSVHVKQNHSVLCFTNLAQIALVGSPSSLSEPQRHMIYSNPLLSHLPHPCKHWQSNSGTRQHPTK
jgi:hypothetical protein